MNNKQPLRKSLKGWLEQDSLTDSEVSELQKLKTSKPDKPKIFSWQRLTAVAAVFCLLAVNMFWILQYDDRRDRIAQEILTNHLKIKPLDLSTSSIGEMQHFFERLDFSPFLSSQVDKLKLKPMGGRYCTLQGNIALQMRLTTTAGKIATYYQSRYDKEYFGDIPDLKNGAAPDTVIESGIKMNIWQERGVVHILAQAI